MSTLPSPLVMAALQALRENYDARRRAWSAMRTMPSLDVGRAR